MRISILIIPLVAALNARADLISWTNTAGGNWNVPANWNPNRVPSTNDTAVITSAGTYTVTLNTDPVIAGLVVGGITGTQTLATSGNTLTLNGEGTVNANGGLNLSGTTPLSGTNRLTLAGVITWRYGAIDTNAAVNVVAGGQVLISSGGINHAKTLHGTLTNNGVITWQPTGNFIIGGTLHNLAQGVFDAQLSASIVLSGTNGVIVNDGVFRRSAGSGNLDCYVPFVNKGAVDTQIGTLKLFGGSVLSTGSAFTGAGVTELRSGTNVLNGTVTSTNLVLHGGALEGAGTLSGTVAWTSGQLSQSACLTVAANGALTFSSGVKFEKLVYGNLTNAGVITWQPIGALSLGGVFHNLPGALFEAQTDNISILSAAPGARIINDGVFRRSAGSSTVSCDVPMSNNGTVEVPPGTLRFDGGYTNPAGSISLAGGTFRTGQPFCLAGGLLTGWGSVVANLTNAATIRPALSNGVLTITGRCEQLLGGRMEFELAGNNPGTNQSRLNITGQATLRGTVAVRWAGNYLPPTGTDFPVMTFASRAGQFCCFDNFFLLGQGRRLTPVYSATGLTLATVAAPEPASVPLGVAVDNGAIVCWPVEFLGCELYYSTNLSHSNWTHLPGVTNRYLEAPPLAQQKYFRLREP